jgi:hypothetical protein
MVLASGCAANKNGRIKIKIKIFMKVEMETLEIFLVYMGVIVSLNACDNIVVSELSEKRW